MERKVRIEPGKRDATHGDIVDAINALGDQVFSQGAQLEAGRACFEKIEIELTVIRELTEVIAEAKAVGRIALCAGRAIKWAGGIAAAIVAFFILWREASAALFTHGAK